MHSYVYDRRTAEQQNVQLVPVGEEKIAPSKFWAVSWVQKYNHLTVNIKGFYTKDINLI